MKESALKIDQVMDKLIPWVAKGLTEIELNQKTAELCKEVGFSGMSFDPITAYGKGGADPHHITDNSKVSTATPLSWTSAECGRVMLPTSPEPYSSAK